MDEMMNIAIKAKYAQLKLAKLATEQKNNILLDMAQKLDRHRKQILDANERDVKNNEVRLNKYMIDRLTLTDNRIDNMINSLKEIANQPDAVGEIISQKTITQGLRLIEKRVGMGVVAVIFEARPNVTSDVIGLCLKSSCAVILKCGKDAANTCTEIIEILKDCCTISNAFQLISERELVQPLLKLNKYIDLIIPRGGEKLIQFVNKHTTIPVLHAGKGNCHIYIDADADVEMAIQIIVNAKTQRPTICNAAEKVVVHKDIAKNLLLKLKDALEEENVEIRGDEETQKIIECKITTEEDWNTEYLALIIAIKVVSNIEEAINHINIYSSKHSEAIISNNKQRQQQFLDEIDAACIYINASTRFTDGYLFGLGAEIGISTQKLHARGPMGLKTLTTTKYLITGDGQARE
ncbi:MAG: glutamate-5-semialdehyde dehydrogenase [Candidatus Woesearchaeota archaeon]